MRPFCSYVILCSVLTLCTGNCIPSCQNITVAIILERSAVLDMPFTINRTIGIIELAKTTARAITKDVSNLEFIVRFADVPNCVTEQWGALAADIYHNNNIQAIIGPGCSNAVMIIGRLANNWNIPIFTYAGTSEVLANKTEFRTLTRLSFSLTLCAQFYVEVFRTFGWTNVANIYDSSVFLPRMVGTSLQRSFVSHGIISKVLGFRADAPDLTEVLMKLLEEAKQVARVFVVCCHGDIFRQLVLMARTMGMEVGEYSFIFYTSQPGNPTIGDYSWERGDGYDLIAKRAYESVFIITPRRPTNQEFLEFEQEAMRLALSLYGYTWNYELGVYNIGHYDAFILYALALRDTLAAGNDPTDGASMTKFLWNRTFQGIGGKVYVNLNGDRDADFSLLDLDPVTGKYRDFHTSSSWAFNPCTVDDTLTDKVSKQELISVKAENKLNGSLQSTDLSMTKTLVTSKSLSLEVNAFRQHSWKSVAQYLGYTHEFELLSDVSIHWPTEAGAHPNTPKCGYVGELCQVYEFPLFGSVMIAFAVAITILILVGVYVFRRMQVEAAIHSQWWRINMTEVTFRSRTTMLGSDKLEDEESVFDNNRQATNATTVGIYKGMQAHIRKSKQAWLQIDRKLLLELKQMRDINCPNLTRFIGMCADTNVYILTEYCSRGSLKDILQNDSIQLDEDFRISLIHDIVQGMHYIHSSTLGVHGSLTSSNCVIDSRFVLKITGFGLPSISKPFSLSGAFWMAPEILRSYPLTKASQPGDVYGFAIILYEMCSRNEPYINEHWYQSVEDTLDQIKSNRSKPRRPSFGNTNTYPEICKLALECWTESPEARPTSSVIRRKIYMLTRKNPYATNVLDTLLHRMEQYANNLEGLAEERTNAFLEEKKRSEELLYELLPRSVADQLKIGHTVIPEDFENVTIYFSDIVGFTSISALCTPLQVVDLLNDVYTCFDGIIETLDVYKVETIGDAYMVVSGLPLRNGNEHVRQIARMSLRILEQVQRFTIAHLPERSLIARIGLHSGPVVAGVVGRKMPRYCLFGGTVTIASSMESNGKPMMVHISDSTRLLLELHECFTMEERGLIDIKGIGPMRTHWLVNEIIG